MKIKTILFIMLFFICCSCQSNNNETKKSSNDDSQYEDEKLDDSQKSDNSGNNLKEEKTFNYLYEMGYSWISSLNEDNVLKIRIELGFVGTSPTSLATIKYSENKTDILKNINIVKDNLVCEEKQMYDGGNYLNITFYVDSNEYNIRFTNDRIYSGNYMYKTKIRPIIENDSITYESFVRESYKIYDSKNNLIGSYKDLKEYWLIEDESIIIPNISPYRVKIVTDYDDIYIYSKDIIVKDGIKYRLINKKFNFLSFNL